MKVPIVLWKEEDCFIASCPLNHVASQGRDISRALENVQEALELYFDDEDIESPPSSWEKEDMIYNTRMLFDVDEKVPDLIYTVIEICTSE